MQRSGSESSIRLAHLTSSSSLDIKAIALNACWGLRFVSFIEILGSEVTHPICITSGERTMTSAGTCLLSHSRMMSPTSSFFQSVHSQRAVLGYFENDSNFRLCMNLLEPLMVNSVGHWWWAEGLSRIMGIVPVIMSGWCSGWHPSSRAMGMEGGHWTAPFAAVFALGYL